MITASDKKINSILLKNKAINQEKSDELLGIAAKENKPFIEVVLDKKVVDEPTLLSFISYEVKLPPIIIEKITPDEKSLEIIPEDKAAYYNILPISKISNILTIAIADPFDVFKLDDIRLRTQCELRLVLTLERQLKSVIKKFYHSEEEKMSSIMDGVTGGPELELSEAEADIDENVDLSQITDESGDSPVIKLVNMLIFKALHEGASDIHIEPYEKRVRVRLRCDGKLKEVFFPPKRLHNAIASRIKIMSGLDISERKMPQDGKFQIKIEGRRIDFRVGVTPTVHGERIVMRLLDSSSLNLSLDDLGFEENALRVFKKSITASYGMVLISGPTGSGKTTTLYCAIKECFDPEENLITVEDPVEYQLPGIIQVSVNPKQGMTFASALRSILRQDPDIIMIGEMRDLETADIGIKAAITGHLVFSTLHTNDAVSTVSRLVDMGIDPFMISSAVLMVANQRLIRKICTQCKTPIPANEMPPPERLISIGFKPEELKNLTLYKAAGCPKCFGGYKGRAAIYEVLEITDEVRRMMIKGISVLEIRDYAIEKCGLITVRRGGVLKALRGETTIEEVLKAT
ncbi:MAG: ATPase, T2SS/T4P/T4SS family [Candidatus Brocadiia bacterium]